jgi:hypothetical protein
MRPKPTTAHLATKICGEYPAVTARDLYLHARLELERYLAQQAVDAARDADTAPLEVPTDEQMLAELERTQGVR